MYLPGANQAMAPGDEYNIIKIDDANKDSEVKDRIINDAQWLKVTIEYESIYREKYLVSGPTKNDFT